MPRYNVEYNGKWACFSTIVDGFVTSFMDKTDYEQWRLEEYGRANYKPAEQCNVYTIAEAIEDASLYHNKKEIVENLMEVGLAASEAVELWRKYKLKPEDRDPEEPEDNAEKDSDEWEPNTE